MAAAAFKQWDALVAGLRMMYCTPEHECPSLCQQLLAILEKYRTAPAMPKAAWKKMLAESVSSPRDCAPPTAATVTALQLQQVVFWSVGFCSKGPEP